MNRLSATLTERVSIDVLQTITGKTPVEWHKELIESERQFISTEECSKHLSEAFGVKPELADRISEMHFALRADVKNNASRFEEITTVTRTFPLGIHIVESYFSDPGLRYSWLDRDFTPTLLNTGRSVRMEGAFPGKVLVNFNGKGPEKCQITIQHLKLADREQAEEIRLYWKDRLELLARVLNCE